MFIKQISITLGIGLILIVGCQDQTARDSGTEPPTTRALTIDVGGMHCEGCNTAIESSLSTLEGVRSVEATFGTGTVHLTVVPETFERDRALKTIQDLGYETAADSVMKTPSRK